MPDPQTQGVQFSRRHATSALTPALMFSLVVHAAAGGALFHYWHHATVELPQPLTVTLEVLPPVIVESRPPAEIKPATHEPKSRALPAPQTHQAPVPAVVSVPSVDAAPAVIAAPVPETPPSPVMVAKAPVAAAAPARTDAIEPPHFDIAYLKNPKPAYPPIARKLGLEGVVRLRVDVNVMGLPEKIVIAQSSGAAILDEAAMKAVQSRKFLPARRGDTPIAHAVIVPVGFKLEN